MQHAWRDCYFDSSIAAPQSDVTVQNDLGELNTIGVDFGRNNVKAFLYYQEAAQQGDTAAQNNLGIMYANGRGVDQDYVEAVKWFRKAAHQGHAEAQDNLRRYRTETSTID